MDFRRLYLLIILLLAAAHTATAQNKSAPNDTVIKGATIEIIQSYKPEVKQTPKPELNPILPPADTAHPVFNYAVPQQLLYYNYSSLPLRPLALGRDTSRQPFPNYFKFGAGNLSTVYLDAGFGGLKGTDYDAAIGLHSISQKGIVPFQQSSSSEIAADVTYHRNNNALHAALDGVRNRYNYYGFNADPAYSHANPDSLKQVFTGVRVNVDLQNELHSSQTFGYYPAISASLYQDKFNAAEHTIGFALPVTYRVDTSLELSLGINGIFTQLKTLRWSNTNNLAELSPGVLFHNNTISGHAFFDIAEGAGNKFYFLPDVVACYRIPGSSYQVSAGWQALLKRNTFEELTVENPYLFNEYTTHQTQSTEVFGDFKGDIGHHLSFFGRISWWQYSNLPLFVNDSGDQKQFRILYEDKLNATSLQGNAKYQVNNTFAVGLTAIFYAYYNNQFAHVWNEPTVRLKGDLLLKPVNGLVITAYLSMLDGLYALSRNGSEIKVAPIVDLGGNAEYALISRLSVFLQISNLLNNKYERWLGYQAYGFNIYGGVRLKF